MLFSQGSRSCFTDCLQQQAASSEPEETDFETFYLKRVTAEFADDLDRLRNANDFNENSLPILVDALKGTAGTYSEEDKAKVMGKGESISERYMACK